VRLERRSCEEETERGERLGFETSSYDYHLSLMLPPPAVYLQASVVARAQESKLVLGFSYLSDSIH
jgi:hypothetical protein